MPVTSEMNELFEAAQVEAEPIFGRIFLPTTDHLGELETRLDLESALSHIQVSEEVRTQCLEELRQAESRGWQL
jgi:hypothetical protein